MGEKKKDPLWYRIFVKLAVLSFFVAFAYGFVDEWLSMKAEKEGRIKEEMELRRMERELYAPEQYSAPVPPAPPVRKRPRSDPKDQWIF